MKKISVLFVLCSLFSVYSTHPVMPIVIGECPSVGHIVVSLAKLTAGKKTIDAVIDYVTKDEDGDLATIEDSECQIDNDNKEKEKLLTRTTRRKLRHVGKAGTDIITKAGMALFIESIILF